MGRWDSLLGRVPVSYIIAMNSAMYSTVPV